MLGVPGKLHIRNARAALLYLNVENISQNVTNFVQKAEICEARIFCNLFDSFQKKTEIKWHLGST